MLIGMHEDNPGLTKLAPTSGSLTHSITLPATPLLHSLPPVSAQLHPVFPKGKVVCHFPWKDFLKASVSTGFPPPSLHLVSSHWDRVFDIQAASHGL